MGIFSSPDDPAPQVVGHGYYLGMHMVLARTIDKITRIDIGNKTAWTGDCTGGQISIDEMEMFGGLKKEGGIQGTIDIEMGATDQAPNDYLQARLGSEIPAWRRVTAAVLRQVYLGTTPYLKKWAFWGQRMPDDWYAGKAAIGQDANPAHCIYELITSKEYGMAYAVTDIDDDSFSAAADTLYSENFGLSFLWQRGTDIESLIKRILDHIDASLYIDRQSGKFSLNLIRDDYTVGDLTTLDESNIIRVTKFARKTDADLVNTVTVEHWDQDTGENGAVTISDTALVAAQGGTISTTRKFNMITRRALAEQVAARELATLSTPLATAQIEANREAAGLNVGDPFVFSWPRYGVTQTVMRVTAIEFGKSGDSAVRIEAVEDVFGMASQIYDTGPASAWESPVSYPAACPVHTMMEVPYYWLLAWAGGDVSDLADNEGYAAITGTPATDDAMGAAVYFSADGSDYTARNDYAALSPHAVLAADIGVDDTALSVSWSSDYSADALAGSWAVIDDEIIRIDAVDDSSMTVGRGCLDTVPDTHAATADIVCVSNYLVVNTTEHEDGDTVYGKMAPITGYGTLDLSEAPAQSVTLDSRAVRPYPPAGLTINGLADHEAFGGDLAYAWAHRDRTQQTGGILGTDDAGVGPETGTTYSFELRDQSDDSLVDSGSSISGTSDSTTNTGADIDVTFTLWAVRDGYTSWQTHQRAFTWTRTAPRETETEESARAAEDGAIRILEE